MRLIKKIDKLIINSETYIVSGKTNDLGSYQHDKKDRTNSHQTNIQRGMNIRSILHCRTASNLTNGIHKFSCTDTV